MDKAQLVEKAKKKYERDQLVAAAKAKYAAQSAPKVESTEAGINETLPAAAEGLSDIATFGYAPQIKAGLAKGVSAITPFSPQQVLATLNQPIGDVISGKAYEQLPQDEQSYVQLRDAAIKQSEGVKSKDPLAYGLGSGLGIAATAGLGTGAALANIGKKGAAEGLKQLGKAGLIGAGTSAAFNPGDIEGVVDPVQAEQRAMAAGIGGALGGAGGLVSKGAQALAPKLMESAEALAARSLGRGTKKFKEKIGEKGMQAIGRKALDEDIVGAIPKTIKGINEKVTQVRNKIGKDIGNVFESVAKVEDELIKGGAKVGVDKNLIVDKLKLKFLDPEAVPSPEFIKKAENKLQSFLQTGPEGVITTNQAHTIRQKIGDRMERSGAWNRIKMQNGSEDDLLDKELYGFLNEAIQDSTSALDQIAPNKIPQNLKELNQQYTMLNNMQRLSKDEMARVGTNNLLDLTSVIAGTGVGAGTQDPGAGLLTAAGLMAARRAGPQVGAKLLEAASKGTAAVGRAPVLPPLAAGLAGGAINKDLVQSAVSRKFPPQVTKGAKLLDIPNYKTSDDMESVDPMMAEQIKAQLPDADLTNTEKATIAEALQKGKVSRRVLEFLQGPAMGPNNNMDAQSVLGR